MRRLTFVVVLTSLLAPGLAGARYQQWVPSKEPIPLGTANVVQVGDIVVMEGEDSITDGSAINLEAIVARFFEMYPQEDYDGIAVFLTFPEGGATGSAYAICQEPGVQGLGTGGGGCPGGSSRLLSVISMNTIDQYPGSLGVDDSQWFLYMGQEFGHSWLTFFTFVDPTSGAVSDELLGRQAAHWASNVNARGSVMDGVEYVDSGNNTFTVESVMVRYSDLDLYAMGIIPPEEVQPFFLIRNPTVGGAPLDTTNVFAVNAGTVVEGTKVNLTINDIIASVGERRPKWDDAPEEFRQAFILVTAPGETAGQVMDKVGRLETGRIGWEERFAIETSNRGYVCTNLTTPCPIASAKILSASVAEDTDQSDGDGIIEPGETATVSLNIFNTGGADATPTATILTDNENVDTPDPMVLPTIPMSQMVTATLPLRITGGACGQEIQLEAVTTIESRTWKAPFSMRPGLAEGEIERFADDANWRVDIEFNDTATNGIWEWGVPNAATFFAGRKVQPESGSSGAGDPAWFTGLSGVFAQSELAGGKTTLVSIAYDLSALNQPILRLSLWYAAFYRPNAQQLLPDENPHLFIDGSTDGGMTWEPITEIAGEIRRWETMEIPLPEAIAASNQARFRFRAEDSEAAATIPTTIVEIGLDDVQIVSLSTQCEASGGGCGCRAGNAGTGGAAAAALALFALGFVVRARRRAVTPRA